MSDFCIPTFSQANLGKRRYTTMKLASISFAAMQARATRVATRITALWGGGRAGVCIPVIHRVCSAHNRTHNTLRHVTLRCRRASR